MSVEKLKAVLILGPDNGNFDKDLLKLYAEPGYLAIGDGIKPMTERDISVLQGQIDHRTRIDIVAHGEMDERDKHHYILVDKISRIWYMEAKAWPIYTLFSLLKKCSDMPLQVHLWSCYGGAANSDVWALGEGAILFNHIPPQYELLQKLAQYSLKKELIKLQQTRTKTSSPIEDFIDSLSHKMMQTASISTYIDQKNYILLLAPKLSEVITNPGEALEKAVVRISNFSDLMHVRLALKLSEVITNPDEMLEKIVVKISRSLAHFLDFMHARHELKLLEFDEDITSPDEILEGANRIYSLIEAKDKKIYSNFKIKEPVVKIFSEDQKNELQVGYLIHACNTNDIKGVEEAIDGLSKSYVERLINSDINGVSPLLGAVIKGNAEIVKILLEYQWDVNRVWNADRNPRTALYIAVQENHIEVVKLLLEHKAYVDAEMDDGTTPLFIAAEYGYVDIVELLIEYKADVDKARKDVKTPLSVAARMGHVDVVETLLAYKADANKASDDGSTPLAEAVQEDNTDVVKILIANGAYVNKARNDGATPISIAVQKCRIEMTLILAANDADVDKALNDGTTPLYIAVQTFLHRNTKSGFEIIKILAFAKANMYLEMLSSYLQFDFTRSTEYIKKVKTQEDDTDVEQEVSIKTDTHAHEPVSDEHVYAQYNKLVGEHDADHIKLDL